MLRIAATQGCVVRHHLQDLLTPPCKSLQAYVDDRHETASTAASRLVVAETVMTMCAAFVLAVVDALVSSAIGLTQVRRRTHHEYCLILESLQRHDQYT